FRDPATIQAVIDQYPSIEGVSYVYVTDSKGDVIAHTFVPQFPEQLRRLNTDSKTTTIQHLAVPGLGEFIDVASPILAGRTGCVHVGMDQSLIQANIRSSILQQAGLMSLILFLGILAAYVLVQRISQPLRRLTEYANKMAATDAANVRSLFLSGESLSNSDRDEV